MKLHIQITLDSGGTVTISSEDVSAEGISEIFTVLGQAGYEISGGVGEEDEEDTSLTDAFVEGFQEGRPPA